MTVSGTMSFAENSTRRQSDLEAGSSSSADFEDRDSSSNPFGITRTKNAPVERLRRWRVCIFLTGALTLSLRVGIVPFAFLLPLCLLFLLFIQAPVWNFFFPLSYFPIKAVECISLMPSLFFSFLVECLLYL